MKMQNAWNMKDDVRKKGLFLINVYLDYTIKTQIYSKDDYFNHVVEGHGRSYPSMTVY